MAPTPRHAQDAARLHAKQRNGPAGCVPLAFLEQYGRFENLVEE